MLIKIKKGANMKNADIPANPQTIFITESGYIYTSLDYTETSGLTKLESIAKDLPHIDIQFNDLDEMTEFLGVEKNIESHYDAVTLAIEIEAKIRVMRAKALLAELEKGE